MARYLGPKCRVARRLGTTLDGLKSKVRDLETKCNMNTQPGMHATKRARDTGHGLQMREKQKFKYMFGVLERQFRRYYAEASRRKGATGETLFKLLECRLDNVVYRMGFACTRAEARQLVRHKALLVNGTSVNIPSYHVQPGDTIEVRERSKTQVRIQDALKLAETTGLPEWVEVDASKFSGTFKRVPDRNELSAELNEQLVVELYAK
jgi:small subunit ribosomal protein S4